MNGDVTRIIYNPKMNFADFCSNVRNANAFDLEDKKPVFLAGEINQQSVNTDIEKICMSIIHCFTKRCNEDYKNAALAVNTLNSLVEKYKDKEELIAKITKVQEKIRVMALFDLARDFEKKKMFTEALKLYREASNKRFAESTWTLANFYYSGLSNQGAIIVKKEKEEALKLTFLALEQAYEGFKDGIKVDLKIISYCGRIFEKEENYTKALECYEFASKRGNREATLYLMDLYNNGVKSGETTIIIKDRKKALDLRHLAALQNDPLSWGFIAVNYMRGEEVPHDAAKFSQYHKIAASLHSH